MEDQNKILKEYVEMELENIISEPQVSTRRRNINALIETMNDLPGDFELKNSIGKKLVAIRSFPKPQMNMKLNDLVGELQTKEMAKGGGFYEGWGFNDTFKVLLTGKPANRNEMYRELGQTFPDSDMDKVKADSIEIFVNDNQIKRLRKLARMFQMKLAYSEGGKMATGGNLTPKQEDKFGKVMHEWKAGDLHSGSKKGPIVKDQDQAVAIAFSEARKMSGGGNIEWKNARIGDSARVTSENKMGVIVKDYGRKFHVKFVDGSEKTFDASELDFYRLDEDEYGKGGGVDTIILQKPYRHGNFQEDIAKDNILEIFNNVSFRKFGNEFRKHIMPSFTQENNASRLTANFRWSDFASYIIGDGSYYVTEEEYNNFIKNFNTTYEDKFKGGGGVDSTTKYKVGDKIKSFEVKKIVDGYAVKYDSNGRKTPYVTSYLLLLSDDGQERILRADKKSLNDAEKYTPTFGHKSKFKTWNMLANTTDKMKDGGDVRDYEWYQGFKVIPNAPKPAHYTAIADLGTRKIKRHLDNRMEVDEFLNEMSDREVISVELSKFTEEGLTRTVKFDWTGDEWNLVSDETVEKKNSKKAE